jgi:hypothetical protein
MNKKFTAVAAGVLAVVWLLLTGFVWFTPDQEVSASERRPLDQMPEFSQESFLDGTFQEDFEAYLKDQFPHRDSFRQLKGVLYTFLLNQKTDANGLFYMDGHLSQHNTAFNEEQFNKRMEVLNQIYTWYLQKAGSNVYVSVIPDKNYYLAQNNNFPVMDYETIFSEVKEQTPWASYIDMTGVLNQDCFYTTDTHWRQETILPVAQLLCQSMGVVGPKAEDYTAEKIDKPFYGVWYGKAGLPVGADELFVLRSEIFDDVKVSVEMKPGKIYDEAQLSSSDPYNIFLSGAKKGFVTIENPNATTDKKLVVFRDSFGSSIAPLFVQDYASVTLIDLRVMSRMNLRSVDFADADVLFMLSALVLNNTSELFL